MAEVDRIVLGAYDRHERELNAFARSLVRDPSDAEDLVAEAFVRLVREVRSGDPPENVRAWLYRVVANLVMSRGRRLRTAKRHLVSLFDRRAEDSSEAHVLRNELSPELAGALASLTPPMRVAIVMAAHGATGFEIAAALGRTEVATRSILFRARRQLQRRLNARAAQGERQ